MLPRFLSATFTLIPHTHNKKLKVVQLPTNMRINGAFDASFDVANANNVTVEKLTNAQPKGPVWSTSAVIIIQSLLGFIFMARFLNFMKIHVELIILVTQIK